SDLKEWIGEIGGGFGWLGIKYVQTGAQLSGLQHVTQRGLVNDFAARGVDENGVRLHERKALGMDQLARVRLERDMQRHDVGPPENVVQVFAAFYTQF